MTEGKNRRVWKTCRGLALFATAFGSLAIALPNAGARDFTTPPGVQFVPGEIIVKLKPGAPAPAAFASATGLSAEPQRTSGGEIVFRLPAAPTALTDPAAGANAVRDNTWQAAQQLAADPNVEYAVPNYFMFPFVAPNDPDYSKQWHYHMIGAAPGQSEGGIGLPDEWATNQGAATVVVAVIDTGIVKDHPDIVGSSNLAGGYDMITNSFIANDGDGRDADATDPGDAVLENECPFGNPPSGSSWHGTHVAGTIGVGRTNNGIGVAGVNWNVKVVPVRVLGKCGGTLVDIADAIRWAAGMSVPNATDNPTPARIINMSLGGRGMCAAPYQSAIDDVVKRGVVVVVAAGNDKIDAGGVQPASCNDVITVAAADARGHFVQRYSNFGTTVALMAPGGDVASARKNGVLSMVKGGYEFYNGTSMASPHVAGVLALWFAHSPDWEPDPTHPNGGPEFVQNVRERLTGSVVPRDSSHGCPPGRCGAGLLSARMAAAASPAPKPLSLSIQPDRLDLADGVPGEVIAIVRTGTNPTAAQKVSFRSTNASVASVSPASVDTDAHGEARASVRGASAGEAMIIADAGDKTANALVRVPSLSATLAIAMAFLLAFGELRLRRRGR